MVQNQEEATPVAQQEQLRANAFSEEQMKQCWNAFTASVKTGSNQMQKYILEDARVELREPARLVVHLNNQLLMPRFEKLKPELHKFLRDGLQNDHLILEAVISNAPPRVKRLYTDVEKLEHLKQKYPALADLQDLLGLDLAD